MSEGQVEPIEADPFSLSETSPGQWISTQVWADITRVFAEFTTICIDFGTLDPVLGTASQEVRLRMSPQAVKILNLYLTLALADWEEKYGDIPLARAEHMVGELLGRMPTEREE